ncbi:MAG: ABC transporter ATP-binding protein, partial [Eubacterium sp.]
MIKIEKLDFSYEGAPLKTLEDINLKIEHGHCTAILGNNGAGKSTLLKCINRIHHTTQGTVSLDGENIAQMNRRQMAQKIAYVPQSSEPTHTMVFDTILLGRRPYIKWDITSKDKEIVQGIIEGFGLEKYAARYMDELSGGERQKVILARAMAQEPKFLLLDEPTSSLDPKNQHEML